MQLRCLALLFAPIAALGCQLVFPYDDGTSSTTSTSGASSGGTTSGGGGGMAPCGGANLDRDADNCGTCGHGCQGGKCEAGACRPVVLESGLPEPDNLTLAGTTLYWTTFGQIPGTGLSKVSIDGGLPKLVAGGAYLWSVLIDGDEVYWATPTEIRRATLAGKSNMIFSGVIMPNWLVQDATRIYWFDFNQHGIYSQGKGETTGTLLYMNIAGSLHGFAIHGGKLYWTVADAGVLQYGPIGGGNATPLASNEIAPAGVAVDTSGIYWAENGDPMKADGKLHAMPVSGGQKRLLASGLAHPNGVWLDDAYVYWTNEGTAPNFTDGTVMRAAKSGPPSPVIVADHQHHPFAIVGDAERVYWTNAGTPMASDGQLMKIAK